MEVALRIGATEAEVKEAIIQMLTYCGMPYVMQAYVAFSEVVRKHRDKEK
ncbi:carboxymuconolactone decarboxylase family protein [Chloroflexota bacterium]